MFCSRLYKGIVAIAMQQCYCSLCPIYMHAHEKKSKGMYQKRDEELQTEVAFANLSLLWSQDSYPIHTAPDAVSNFGRQLAASEPLVNEPHAHHKLLSVEIAVVVTVYQAPSLGKLVVGQP